MSKRYIFPQQQNDRKKPKLNVTISDHNFPLSQKPPNKDTEQNNWGDDNDDEILLLASQACEDVYNDLNSLPDYSLCMQPKSTSTQLFDPGPSTSKTSFNFKKPTASPPSAISSNLKDKCTRISSPLPGISSKMLPKATENNDFSDDLIFNDKIYKGQDSDFLYKQLLQLQEENNKLKSENGKLLEKCVTKEGEASILRTQLKTCQVAVDNARMEKIKAQEKVQMEWTGKLGAVNEQVHELRTQLDFKNLEIISIKEKCKMLESNKVKLTQVTVTNNDISMSQRNNTSNYTREAPSPLRRVKMTSNGVQTDDKAPFLKLNKSYRTDPQKLTEIIPLVLQPTSQQHSLLEYNEKLHKQTDLSQNRCRVFTTFHRIPTSPGSKQIRGAKSDMTVLNDDLTGLALNGKVMCFGNILKTVQRILQETYTQLEQISRAVNTAFQREMDEKYIEGTGCYMEVRERDLLSGKQLYKEEQSVIARRLTAVLYCILRYSSDKHIRTQYDEYYSEIIELFQGICNLLDTSSCALLYSGLLLSLTHLINESISTKNMDYTKITDLIKTIISSRAMPFVALNVLKVLRELSLDKRFLGQMCPGGSVGNLRLDYDQGVLLYKKDSCHLQILLKQIESALKCIEKQELTETAVDVSSHLIALYSNVNDITPVVDKEKLPGCDCQLILLQIIVYALRICATMLQGLETKARSPIHVKLLSVCRSGIQLLYGCVSRDLEFSSQLQHSEGYLLDFAEIMSGYHHSETYVNMVSELCSSLQCSPEEPSPAFLRQPWLHSFDNFTIAD